MAIRYDKKINAEINRTIRNFNQKISRLQKAERDLILPEKITKQALKESVMTRQELKRKLNELKRYSTRGIENTLKTSGGYTLSKYEFINLKKESARIKRNLTREIKRFEMEKPTVFGKVQARTFAEMGDTFYLNLVAKRKALEKKLVKLTPEEILRYKKLLTMNNRAYNNQIFKENYLKALTELGYFYEYDSEKLENLEKRLNKINNASFLRLFESEKAIKAILEYYPFITKNQHNFNPEDIKDDVNILYDNLITNLDDILKDYA